MSTNYGTSARFRGDFGASYTDPETGAETQTRSNQLFLPRHVESMLIEAIDAALHDAGGDASQVAVQFGFRIYQSPIDAKAGRMPYEWSVENVLPIQTTAADAVAALLEEYAGGLNPRETSDA